MMGCIESWKTPFEASHRFFANHGTIIQNGAEFRVEADPGIVDMKIFSGNQVEHASGSGVLSQDMVGA